MCVSTLGCCCLLKRLSARSNSIRATHQLVVTCSTSILKRRRCGESHAVHHNNYYACYNTSTSPTGVLIKDVYAPISLTLHDNSFCSVDATKDDGRLGRLINHSKKTPNVVPQVLELNNAPHVYFSALVDIEPGQEILYDYGDRSQKSIDEHPWLIQ